jgi:hypothetical protein
MTRSLLVSLLLLITPLKERQETLERSLVNEQTKVSALENRTQVLEGSVSDLSAERGLLFAEQAYRPGCEFLVGANGFGDGARLSSHLGLQCLKRALMRVTRMLNTNRGGAC